MTLGPALAVLPLLERLHLRTGDAMVVFGQTPLFFYLVHLPLLHLASLAYAQARFGTARVPSEAPVSVALILGAWIGVTVLLWPACKAWRRVKRARPHPFVAYL